MAWFERLVGFRETNYEETRARLEVAGDVLRSRINGASFTTGDLELVSLTELRERVADRHRPTGRLRVSVVRGDVREMHRDPTNAGVLFQVASQFNLLEMVGPHVTPEDGVTRYQHDHTQGPACAIAAGAATIYRNYFAPVGDGRGQTATRQLDGLHDFGASLSMATGRPVSALWQMTNGYALATKDGLDTIARYLNALSDAERDALRGLLRVGLHRDVEATEMEEGRRHTVSQVFCSALPIAYSGVAAPTWEPFARLILEAAYEATLWAAILNVRRGGSNIVYLTLLGGGAFGNPNAWIDDAIARALDLAFDQEINVRLVSYGAPSPEVLAVIERASG